MGRIRINRSTTSNNTLTPIHAQLSQKALKELDTPSTKHS